MYIGSSRTYGRLDRIGSSNECRDSRVKSDGIPDWIGSGNIQHNHKSKDVYINYIFDSMELSILFIDSFDPTTYPCIPYGICMQNQFL